MARARRDTPERTQATAEVPETTRKAAPAPRPPARSGEGTGGSLRRVIARQLILVSAFFASLFVLVALFSFHPEDPSLSRASSSAAVANLGGWFGAYLSDILLQLLGYGAWSLVAVPVAVVWILAGRRAFGGWKILSAAFLLTQVSAAVHLGLGSDASQAFPPGGLLGIVVGNGYHDFFGAIGAWLALSCISAWFVTILAGVDWGRLAELALRAVERTLQGAWALVRMAWGRMTGAVSARWAALKEKLRFRPRRKRRVVEDDVEPDSLPPSSASEPEESEAQEPDYTPTPQEQRTGLDKPTEVAVRELVEVEWEEGPQSRAWEPPWKTKAPAMEVEAPPAMAQPPAPVPSVPRSQREREVPAARVHQEPRQPSPPPAPPARPGAGEPQRAVSGAPVAPTPDSGDAFAAFALRSDRGSRRAPAGARMPSEVRPPAPSRRDPGTRHGEPLPESVQPAPVAAAPPPGPADQDEPVPVPVAPSDVPAANPAAPRQGNEAVAAPAPRRKKGHGIALEPGNLVSGGEEAVGQIVMPTDPATPFELPSLNLLDKHERDIMAFNEVELHALARSLEEKLSSFGIQGEVTAIRPGPVITTFEYLPGPGIKISRISSLADDIAMAMKALRVRIVAPIPGKGVVGIEIPNEKRQTVWIRDILSSEAFRKGKFVLPNALGRSVEGHPVVADLSRMPHLLVGGTTGSGKSVGINAAMLSMLFTRTPEELKFILIDPKMLEFELYQDIPHLLHPVVTDVKLAAAALKWACAEMDRRYRMLAAWGTRSIEGYNKLVEQVLEGGVDLAAIRPRGEEHEELGDGPPRKLPHLVIVIDELADLMMTAPKEVEESIVRLAQKARAAGIHLIVATQRPSVDVITGLIKANMPARIAFQVRSKIDGRTILDQNGAEALLGKGDMLFLPPGVGSLQRVHGPFVSDEEVRRVADYLRSQGLPVYEADIRAEPDGEGDGFSEEDYDEYYDMAVELVKEAGKASTSMIQRHLKIGYNRAARIIELMERDGLVGPADGARPRDVLGGHSSSI